ncbi:class I adenylate-forming enzyme family protein [Lentzea aerocolonigenes]|uniref:class I adenylate-forming enzyme family protein n=1 Tax=Lentzea aerocolonigenes TaxID=68170 RepID=UPI00068F4C65|nr:AMP-binding protein [Lentzea aerocolonigenes]MCP2241871.1 long-chain acyl-CoA synthetase [Lentzea aerocolonigenes]
MTLGELFDEAVARFGDRPVLLGPDMSYVDYAARVNGCAQALRDLGMGRGDAVAAVLPNSPLLLTLWLAVAKLGAVFVPLNPALRDAELEPLLAHSEAVLVVTDRPLPWRSTKPGQLDVTAPTAPAVQVDPGDPVTLLYTSGTTGAPKGCVLSHTSYTAPAPAFVLRLGLVPEDRLLACLPLFHMAGQSFAVSALQAGASIGVVPKFSASGFWDQVARFDATVFRHLGEMLTLVLRSPVEPAEHNLRLVYGGGARPDVAREFTERFGTAVVEGYGMSETNTVLCGDPYDPRPGSMGTPLPPAEVRVDAPAGEIGEIQVRGPGLMKGYHRDPARTRTVFTESWLRTGDLGWMDDDAHVYFAARRTDVIRRRGEHVDPAEVEEALAEHPAVLLGAVVGVPGEMSDEDVAAFVVPLPGARLDAADVRTWCRTRLASFKVPNHVHVVDRLPMTPTSKINRSLLRAAGAHGRTRW